MSRGRALGLGMAALAAAGWALAPPSTLRIADSAREPTPWHALDAHGQARFDLGHAVFNTSWLPAGSGGGRRDGLGPQFVATSCDACHNSRRRGRGPAGDGPLPPDMVVQVGQRATDGSVVPGHPQFGQVANTAAIEGFSPEARIEVHYRQRTYTRADGSRVLLHMPVYRLHGSEGFAPEDLVLMPRVPPAVLGSGLLERIPVAAIAEAAAHAPAAVRGRIAWRETSTGRSVGRFGWQATEPSIASQTSAAFAREMGLSNPLHAAIDCAAFDHACLSAPTGGDPEVAADLFAALVAFQQDEAMRRTPAAAARLARNPGQARVFARIGCADCHRPAMPTLDGGTIAPYTDLLLHDLGRGLADRDLAGRPVPSLWRTAPLWGLSVSVESGRSLRLLHDGRARSIEEAIAWHGGVATGARMRFDALAAGERQALLDWIAAL